MSNEIALEGINRKSWIIRHCAEGIGRYVRMLTLTPEWETLAEDELNKAELALTETLLAVKLAKGAMAKKRSVQVLEAAE